MTAKSKFSKGHLTSVPQSVIELLGLKIGDYIEWSFTKDTSYVLVRRLQGETSPKQGGTPSPTPPTADQQDSAGESGDAASAEHGEKPEQQPTFAQTLANQLHYDPIKPSRLHRIRSLPLFFQVY